MAELERLKPAELLVPEDQSRELGLLLDGEEADPSALALRAVQCPRLLTDQLGTLDLRGFGADDLPLAIAAAGALLQYVRETQKPRCRTSRSCAWKSVAMRCSSTRPRAATWKSTRRCRDRTRRRCSRCWIRPARPWARASCALAESGSPTSRNAPALPGAGVLVDHAASRACANRCAPSATWSASWRVSRCAAHGRGSHRAARFDRGAARAARRIEENRSAADRRADGVRRRTQRCRGHPAAGHRRRALVVLREGDVIAAGYDAALDVAPHRLAHG